MRKEADGVDVARVSDQIDGLIEKRSRQHAEANFEEMAWKESVRRHHERLRRERRAEWVRYWSVLADSLRASADEFDARAERLLEQPDRGEGGR